MSDEPETAVGLPRKLARRRNAVLCPRDAADVYAHPRPALARLARRGALQPVAHGYYVVVSQRRLADPRWRPELHATALGIAVADYGINDVVLMGTSAARHHGALPRTVAVVAIPRQRPVLSLDIGQVVFVKRQWSDSMWRDSSTTSSSAGSPRWNISFSMWPTGRHSAG